MGKVGDHSNAIKKYMGEYMGKVNPKYQDFAELLVKMYRHGLLHQLQPNRIKYKNSILEWNLHYRENYCDHLVCKNEGKRKTRFYLNIERFVEDFMKSIDIYEKELQADKFLKINYYKALKGMEKPIECIQINPFLKKN